MFDLVIRGAQVVLTDSVQRLEIGVSDGNIAALSPELPNGRRELDATGLRIMPGVIDVHVHFNEPGREEWEGAYTGSLAFAAGGGTLYFDMPLNSTPCTITCRDFDRKREALERESVTDFALWGGIVPGNRDELQPLAGRGVVGYKAFLSDSGLPEFPRADDLTLYEGMREAAEAGLPVAVHAESEEITRGLTERLRSAGRTDIQAWLESRPVIAEVEAIHRAATIAREAGCRLHIVHISSGRGIAAALEARAAGTDISIETCPHYLFFTEEDLHRIGAFAKCAPPLRSEQERQALWAALARGEIDVVGSDHSPSSPEKKQSDDFFGVWGGIAGVQSTLAVMLDQGFHARDISLPRIASVLSAKPAERFRIPNRGRIQVGHSADLTLVDLSAKQRLTAGDLRQRHAISPYVGYEFRGEVKQTLVGGRPIETTTRGSLVRPERK